ncbi:hypothetical protein EDD15DRAFT_2440996 [Pisolithus albus]|nr:hypothetical protein EDD15DRAFT_2440996 [Pisolithus albus]
MPIIGRVTFFPPPNSADSQFGLAMVILPPFQSCKQLSIDLVILSPHTGTAQVARSLDYVDGNRVSAIIKDFPLVDHARGYRVTLGHTSDYITNHDSFLPPSYSSLLLPYAIEQSSGHLRESGEVSTFGYLDNNSTGPTVGPGFVRSLRNRTPGGVVGSDAPWPWISDPLPPSLQKLHPLDDVTYGNIPLAPEQTHRAGMVVPPQFLSSITMQPTEQLRPWTPFPYAYPILFQSNSTSYSTSDRYISSQNTSSCSPQEHLGYALPVHPHDVRPVELPGFHGIDTGSKIELHTSDTLDNYAAQVLGNHLSHTLSDCETCLLHGPSTHIPGDHTTGGGVDDCRSFDGSKFNYRASRSKGRRRSRTCHHMHRSATAQSRPTRPPKARSGSIPCGWRDDEGKKCGKPISYDDCPGHFATAHGIRNKAWNAKVICSWCSSEPHKVVTRKNFLRHLKEVHFCYARSENGN